MLLNTDKIDITKIDAFGKTYQDYIDKNTLLKLNLEKYQKNKDNTISSIMSSKYFDEGHIIRIDFLKFLESKDDITLKLDIYGQDNIHKFKNYRGQLEMKNKSNGIKGYKYYLIYYALVTYIFLLERKVKIQEIFRFYL